MKGKSVFCASNMKATHVRQLTPEALRGLAAADAKDAEVLMQASSMA